MLLDPGSQSQSDPDPGPRIRNKHQGSFSFKSLVTIFGFKILKFYVADPDLGSGTGTLLTLTFSHPGWEKSDPEKQNTTRLSSK
jgi:hypothetical protein